MTDSAALARELAELDRAKRHYLRGRGNLRDTLVSNLPAILRALCVQAAVDLWRAKTDSYNSGVEQDYPKWINERADELLAECTGSKNA